MHGWVDCLLDPTRTPSEHSNAAQAWHQRWLALLGEAKLGPSPRSAEFTHDLALECGKAISPLVAARCLEDYPRTARLLQATHAALTVACEHFVSEPIHVLEAGCGPFAPLSLALADRFPPSRVRLTLLDAHAVSLAAASTLATRLGLAESLNACLCADASTIELPRAMRPHLVVCELIQRGLIEEPQVAATINLARQLRPGGLFLPERIEVHLALFDAHARYSNGTLEADAAKPDARKGITDLGRVFTLDAAHPPTAAHGHRLSAGTAYVPPHHPARTPLHWLTRIQVFREHRLDDFACAITLPQKLHYPDVIADLGASLSFEYEMGREPGLRWRCDAAGLSGRS